MKSCHYSSLSLTCKYTDRDQSPPPPSYKTSDSTDLLARPRDLSDTEEEDQEQQSGHLPRKGGYDGRTQQVLYENPDVEIIITDAGKSAPWKLHRV